MYVVCENSPRVSVMHFTFYIFPCTVTSECNCEICLHPL